MTQPRENPKVDAYLRAEEKWREESAKLRQISLGCGLTEELKWGKPCYSHEGANVAIVQGFKESCAYMFFKGALLKDPKGILKKPGDNSQAAKRIEFASLREIAALEPTIKAYIREAIAVEKAGLQVEFKKSPEPVPAELQKKLDAGAPLKKAFAALTPGRQRAYILFISGAKQSATRDARVAKCAPQILAGKGLND